MIQFVVTGLTLILSFIDINFTKTKKLNTNYNHKNSNIASNLFPLETFANTKYTNMPKFNYIKITSTDLILEIPIKDLSNEEQLAFFGKTYNLDIPSEDIAFIQDEDFIFDLNTLLYLELDPGFRLLKKGIYPLRFREEKVQVLLSLSPYH